MLIAIEEPSSVSVCSLYMGRAQVLLADFRSAFLAASRFSAFFDSLSAREGLVPFAALASFGGFAAFGALGAFGGLVSFTTRAGFTLGSSAWARRCFCCSLRRFLSSRRAC